MTQQQIFRQLCAEFIYLAGNNSELEKFAINKQHNTYPGMPKQSLGCDTVLLLHLRLEFMIIRLNTCTLMRKIFGFKADPSHKYFQLFFAFGGVIATVLNIISYQ